MKSWKFFLPIISIFIALCVFCGAKSALASTEISSDIVVATTWKAKNSPYVVTKVVQVKAPLAIEAGTVVKFSNILSQSGPVAMPSFSLQSSFTAIGNPLENIVFTSACDDSFGGDTFEYCSSYSHGKPMRGDWGWIFVVPENRGRVSIEYAKILYASTGIKYDNSNPELTYKELSLKHSEIKFCSGDGIFLRFTQPTLDGLVLTGNYNGVYIYNSDANHPAKIRNSAIVDNTNGISAYFSAAFDARYNFWGDSSGPYFGYNGAKEKGNYAGTGNRIVGTSVLFSPWSQSDPTIPKEAVIFVPGIGASINPDLMISGVLADNWTMFDHTYDGILQAFKVMGYQEGKNFFIAYYDWRKSNVESAEKYLKPLIQKALENSDATKVNIVTHSMGSLVARSYVQSDEYANDVDNLIMIAPPNKGSSDVYTAWEGGYIPKNWYARTFMYAYIDFLSVKGLTLNTYDTIHKYIPSLKELMPVYDFLHLAGDAENLKDFLSMHEQNDFLLDLNEDSEKLNQRTRFSIILGDKQPTVNKIPTIDSDKSGVWLDGKPDPIDPQQNDESGDGEVLISSGDVTSAFRDVLEYGHSEIVSKSEKIVAQRLNENLDEIYDSPEIENEMFFWTDAPADMQVTDPDGNVISKDGSGIQDGIYAQEKNKDGFKIASVPNVKKGEYTVSLDGNEDGKYHIGVSYIDHKDNDADKSESLVVEIQKDQTQNLIIASDPSDDNAPIAEIVLKDEIAPTVTIYSPEDGMEYSNDQILPITFLVTDNVSKRENIVIEKWLDDELVAEDSIDLSKLSLGNEHDFWINAFDEVGNYGFGEVFFKIKKALPPVVIVPDPPPITDPPATDPPDIDPPIEDPPVTDPPVTEPPVTDPPATDPSDIDPPVVEPSEIISPEIEPPATDPSDIDPPATDPSDIDPPATDPSDIDPPATDPLIIADAVAPQQSDIVLKDTAQNDDDHKAKSQKKSTTHAKSGVTKSKGKVKIISSTKTLPKITQNNEEVLGEMTDRSFEKNNIDTNSASQKQVFVSNVQLAQQKISLAILIANSNNRFLSALGKLSAWNVSAKGGKVLLASDASSLKIAENNSKRNYWFVTILGLLVIYIFSPSLFRTKRLK